MDMPRNADVRLRLLDKPARRRAPNRLSRHDPIASRLERRRVTHHHQRSNLANLLIPLPQDRVDLILGELSRRVEGSDIRASTPENPHSIDHHPPSMKRYPLSLQKRHHFAPIQVAGQSEDP